MAVDAVRSAGGDPDYDLFFDEPADTPYEAYEPERADRSSEIVVVESAGNVAHFATISPLTQALNSRLMFRRIHCKAEWVSMIRGLLERQVG
jgi:hypothetical protein